MPLPVSSTTISPRLAGQGPMGISGPAPRQCVLAREESAGAPAGGTQREVLAPARLASLVALEAGAERPLLLSTGVAWKVVLGRGKPPTCLSNDANSPQGMIK